LKVHYWHYIRFYEGMDKMVILEVEEEEDEAYGPRNELAPHSL